MERLGREKKEGERKRGEQEFAAGYDQSAEMDDKFEVYRAV